MSKSSILMLLIFVNVLPSFAQTVDLSNKYVKTIEGDSVQLLKLNNKKSITIIANTLSCSGCLNNLIAFLDSLSNKHTLKDVNLNIIICIGEDVLQQRQQIIFFKKKSKLINVYFENINYDTHLSYRKPDYGILKDFNATGNPILLLINNTLITYELINYNSLFNEINVSDLARKKIINFLCSR